MSDDGPNERSERLRRRRAAARSETGETDETRETRETGEPSESSKPSKPSKPSEPSETGETGEPSEPSESATSVKAERVGTYMYLPEGLKQDLDRLYTLLKADYEYEYGREFEKNRDFYPLVVSYGVARLEGADAEALHTMLEEVDARA